MTKLYPVIFISLIFAYLTQHPRLYTYKLSSGRKLNHYFLACLALSLILFAGLRTAYNDTGGYTYYYRHLIFDETAFEQMSWSWGDNPGFYITNIMLKRLGFSDQSFLMFYAVITLSIYLWFIYRYSTNPLLSVFLMLTMGVYSFTMAAIKQCVAMALCLVATHHASNKKWIPCLLFVLIASTFHVYALMFAILPLLNFRPWSARTYLMLGAFAIVGLTLKTLLGTVISITSMLGEEYELSTLTGGGVNPFRLAVVSVPAVISMLVSRNIKAENDEKQNMILNLAMLNAEIMFVALFGTANYFARLANYFIVFQIVTLPWLFTFFEKKSKRLVTTMAVLCYSAYMYYGQAINEYFDGDYKAITLMEYIRSLFG